MQRHTLKTAGLLSLQPFEWTNTENVTFVFATFSAFSSVLHNIFTFISASSVPWFVPSHLALFLSCIPPREKGVRAFAVLDSKSGCWVCMCVGVSLSPLQSNNHIFDRFERKEWAQLAGPSSGPAVGAAGLNLALSMWSLFIYLFVCLFVSLFWMVKRWAATVSQNTGGVRTVGCRLSLIVGKLCQWR